MKMKRGLTLIVIGVFLFQLVGAIDTQIIVKTIPYHKVDIRASNPADDIPIDTFYKTSNLSGDVSVTLSSSLDSFNVAIWVYEEKRGPENVIAYKKFDEAYSSGTTVSLELYPEGYVLPVPVEETPAEVPTANHTANATVTNNTSGQSITGAVQGILSNKVVLYGAGALVLLIIIGILIYFFMRVRKKRYYKYGFKKNDWDSYKKEKGDLYNSQNQKQEFQEEYSGEDELSEAERKIREAQETIRRIKNQGKVTELKNKLQEDKNKMLQDQQELARLSGKNPNPNKKKWNDFNQQRGNP